MANDRTSKTDTRLGNDIDLARLERSLLRPRTVVSFALTTLTTLLTLGALVPLFAIIIMLFYRGGKNLRLSMFWQLPPVAMETGGGFGNALIGTLLMVGIAAAISIPLGIMAAILLAEIAPDSKLAGTIRFAAKMMTGFPSILAGVFVYGTIVLMTGFSAWAGGIALALLMFPTVLLTAEEAIRMVPQPMKEAAVGMGATRSQTVWKIVLPTAWPSILTGVMLAVARAAGETAPLLFTASFTSYWLTEGGQINLNQPTASMSVLIYNFYGKPYDNLVEMAWTASLVLVLMVLFTNLIGQMFSKKKY